jgi:spore coat polysaccharide biosynthesis predicted glycosyltransferase SpsG
MVLLVCHASPAVGLGHLSRMLALARAMRGTGIACCLLVCGEAPARKELEEFPHRFVAEESNLCLEILRAGAEAVVFDLHPKRIPNDLPPILDELGYRGVRRIAVDGMLDQTGRLDLVWIPSFHLPLDRRQGLQAPIRYGWGCYLIRRHPSPPTWQPGRRVLVLTGGGDTAGLGLSLPRLLDSALPEDAEICWVRGPFAGQPEIPSTPRLGWAVEQAPEGLGDLLAESHYVLTVYGVSLFESLQCGRPTVVFSPYGEKDNAELAKLREEDVAAVAADAEAAVRELARLMGDHPRARHLATAARNRMARDGAAALAAEIAALLPAPA